jgi:uncharacterized repeat protein (TIGR01451 family)
MLDYTPKSLRYYLHRSILAAILCSPIFAVRSAQATPIDCNSVYIDVNSSTQIYSVNTSTAIVTPTATLPVASSIGIAVLPGTTPTLYSDTNTNPRYITSTNGNATNATTSNINATLTGYGGGIGADVSGRLFYFGTPKAATTNSGSQTLYQFPTPATAAVKIATITSTDPVWGQLRPGDMMSDGNGRLYYFGTSSASATVNYLFYVDSNNVAHRLGQYNGGTGIGVAFDSAGTIYTLDSTNLYKIDLNNGFSAVLVGSTKTAVTGGTTVPGIDMGSCAMPVINPNFSVQDGIVKKVRNVTTGETVSSTQNKASVNDILEYQITIDNSGNLPSDSTKFSDAIPAGTTYIANSTKMYDSTGTLLTAVTNYPDISGSAPFTAVATGTTPATAAGMFVNTYGQFSGIVTAGASNAVVVKFQVKVTATNGIIPNAATVTYPKQAAAAGGIAGANTIASQTSNFAKTTLSIKVSGTVWNDLDGSGTGGFNLITTPPGEVGTNANNGLYAILVDGSSTPKVIGSTAVLADGTYSFPVVAPNQTGVTIRLSTTPGTVNNTTIPPQGIPTGWKSTTPKLIPAFNVALIDLSNEDFGITQAAGVILVKRITAINGLTTNDGNNLTAVVDPTTTSTLNDDDTKKWPAGYLKGAVNAGKIQPGDTIEYTIYYLNDGVADAKAVKICDPIRGNQTYVPGSMKLIPGGTTTPIPLTDSFTDTTVDRAYAYGAAALPAVVTAPGDCNVGSIDPSLKLATDNGGVAIQLIGTGANPQLTLPALNGATGVGAPSTSYGSFKFTTKVDK